MLCEITGVAKLSTTPHTKRTQVSVSPVRSEYDQGLDGQHGKDHGDRQELGC